MVKKLKGKELTKSWDKNKLSFNSTDEIEPFSGMIGQERAERSLEFGLSIRNKPFHIYVSGEAGTGRTSFSKEFALDLAKGMKTPPDLVYVYNFKEPKMPSLLSLPSGLGVKLKQDMEDLVALIEVSFSKNTVMENFEEEQMAILKSFKLSNDLLIDAITEQAKEKGFGVKSSNSGIYFMPMVNDEMISEEAYNDLSDREKKAISEESDEIQMKAMYIMNNIRKNDEEADKQIELLSFRMALQIIGRLVSPLLYKYKQETGVISYLKEMKEDFLENIEKYFSHDSGEDLSPLFPFLQRRQEDFLLKYRVNVFTSSLGEKGAPVIVEYNPSFATLIGEVEFDSDFGNLITDYMKIKPGVLHKANGGFLVLQAVEVLQSNVLWDSLKKVLKTGELAIEPLREIITGIAMEGVKPEKAPIDVKLILIGSHYIYDQLANYDDDFNKLFKIHAMFDEEMDYSFRHVEKIAGFIKKSQLKYDLLPFSRGAVSKVIDYSARLAAEQDKLSAAFGKLSDILVEASAWASIDGKKMVTSEYINKALAEDEYRKSLYSDKTMESVLKNIIAIDTVGSKIGQINGMAVLSSGDYVFGKVLKVTATTFMGKSGIVSIEKEAELSGEIHDKGVSTIAGFLGQRFAQNFPLSVTCHVSFEQSYGGIDGDSASSTTLYAVLSSLSKMPIRQDLAVTGSVNQWGEIQAIGGVIYKIEAFFDLCDKRGLTGTQGIIIPKSNMGDLLLKNDVIQAVNENKFHIYAIDTIEEGIELLTGLQAGKALDDGLYEANSVFEKVYNQLAIYDAYDNPNKEDEEDK